MISLARYNKAQEADFQHKVKIYMQKGAIAVMAEPDITVNHADRVIYASKVLNGTASILEFALGVVTNSTIGNYIETDAAIPETDLEFTVNSLIDAFAG